jgi:hypothetical protein
VCFNVKVLNPLNRSKLNPVASEEQLFLFSESAGRYFCPEGVPEAPALEMDLEALQEWKRAIARYQQEVRHNQVEQQATLFADQPSHTNPLAIDPFFLQQYNFFFFEQPASKHPSKACIYFVIDTSVPVILYVGETVKANQRWKGVHDCKRYVLHYRELHYRHRLDTTINTAFYWHAPTATHPRQQLESALIERWRSPFNKENWTFWGTPFVS